MRSRRRRRGRGRRRDRHGSGRRAAAPRRRLFEPRPRASRARRCHRRRSSPRGPGRWRATEAAHHRDGDRRRGDGADPVRRADPRRRPSRRTLVPGGARASSQRSRDDPPATRRASSKRPRTRPTRATKPPTKPRRTTIRDAARAAATRPTPTRTPTTSSTTRSPTCRGKVAPAGIVVLEASLLVVLRSTSSSRARSAGRRSASAAQKIRVLRHGRFAARLEGRAVSLRHDHPRDEPVMLIPALRHCSVIAMHRSSSCWAGCATRTTRVARPRGEDDRRRRLDRRSPKQSDVSGGP